MVYIENNSAIPYYERSWYEADWEANRRDDQVVVFLTGSYNGVWHTEM